MSAIKTQELKRRYQLDGAAKTTQHLREALSEKHLAPEDFSIRDLAEGLIPDGPEWVRTLDPRHAGPILMEAEGVDVTAFLNITGQLIVNKVLEGYNAPAFVMSRLVPNVPTRLDGEKIPGIGRLSDEIATVHPGMPYPHAGVSEDYIETPSTTKRGLIVPLTKEAIFFDRTGLILRRGAEVGQVLGLNKEKRLLDMLIGVTNNYKWKGTSYDTYQAATPWINSIGSNILEDWTDVDAIEQLFADMLDPNTSEPILITAADVVVCPARAHAAHRVFEATEIRYTVGSAETQTLAANPLRGQYRLSVSALLYRRVIASGQTAANSKNWWFMGQFDKAFAYMENWPLTVAAAAAGSDAEFNNDIVAQFKASERGAAAVVDPRFVVKSYGS